MPGDERELRESALRRIVSLALDEDLDSAGDITSRAAFGPAAAGPGREAAMVSSPAPAQPVPAHSGPSKGVVR